MTNVACKREQEACMQWLEQGHYPAQYVLTSTIAALLFQSLTHKYITLWPMCINHWIKIHTSIKFQHMKYEMLCLDKYGIV
jgi:hypothetical protein